jgi:hypothetical protein
VKEGGKKAINMSKTTEVLQGPDESPSQFYEAYVRLSICTQLSTQTWKKTRG